MEGCCEHGNGSPSSTEDGGLEDNINTDFKQSVGGWTGLHRLRQGSVAGSYENDNERSGSLLTR